MAKPIVINIRAEESAVPRIEAFAANVRAECNDDDKKRARPCKFEFVGVSLAEYREDGTFDIDYHCAACNFALSKTVIVNMYDDRRDRGENDNAS